MVSPVQTTTLRGGIVPSNVCSKMLDTPLMSLLMFCKKIALTISNVFTAATPITLSLLKRELNKSLGTKPSLIWSKISTRKVPWTILTHLPHTWNKLNSLRLKASAYNSKKKKKKLEKADDFLKHYNCSTYLHYNMKVFWVSK